MKVDDNLKDWGDLDGNWPTMLLGNGFSINLWQGFDYRDLSERLSGAAGELVKAFGTANFEEILQAIGRAGVILDVLGRTGSESREDVDELYRDVQSRLLDRVIANHVSWVRFRSDAHEKIVDELLRHERVFTTNYDLNLYWSVMWAKRKGAQSEDQACVDDFFRRRNDRLVFLQSRDRALRHGSTGLYYLHGAVHLWRDDDGEGKFRANGDDGLLSQAKKCNSSESDSEPLYVSEGTAEEKLRKIEDSAYLKFCIDSLRKDEGDIVILGHGLSDQDQHVVDAVSQGRRRRVAISMRRADDKPETSLRIIEDKARLRRMFADHEVCFFDSATHPLGSRRLRIPT